MHALLLETMAVGNPNALDIARQLGMGRRTLQRRLSDEGTSFQGVVADTRQQMAQYFLTTTDLSGEDISYLLGYDKPGSFYRAFQRWTGTTPMKLREQAAATASEPAVPA